MSRRRRTPNLPRTWKRHRALSTAPCHGESDGPQEGQTSRGHAVGRDGSSKATCRPRCYLPEWVQVCGVPQWGWATLPPRCPHRACWSAVPRSPGPHLHSSDGDGGTCALGECGHSLGGTAGRSDVVHRHVHLGKTDGHGVKTIQPGGSPHPQNPTATPPDPTASLCPRKGAVCQPAAGTSDAASEATSDTPMREPGPGMLNKEPPREHKLPPRAPGRALALPSSPVSPGDGDAKRAASPGASGFRVIVLWPLVGELAGS